MSNETYIGHRYVPQVEGEWSNNKAYEELSIVLYEGNSYTSKQKVPEGVDIKNETFWVLSGNYNAQMEQLRQDTTTQLAQTKLDSDTAVSGLTVDSEVLLTHNSAIKNKTFSTLDSRLEEIEADNKLKANKVQEAWIEPTLLNGWVNTNGLAPISYMKDDFGFIHIRGMAVGGTGGTVFILPTGYKSEFRERFVSSENYLGKGNVGTIDIYASGEVISTSYGTGVHAFLSGIKIKGR